MTLNTNSDAVSEPSGAPANATPELWDAVIIGGGPAGSSTALHLVRAEGVRPGRVLILDKATFPRDKPCAGAVSQHGLDVLRGIGVGVAPNEVPQVAMKGVRVVSGDDVGETVEHMGIVIRRTELDTHLLRTAASDGVEVRDGEGLKSITRAEGHRFDLVTTSNRSLRARFVIAADGAGSTTRKLLGLREPDRKGHLYVLDTPTTSHDTGVGRGLIDFDLTVLDDGLEGYYWDFPTVIGGDVGHVSRGIYHANITRSTTPKGESVKDVLARSLDRRGVDIAKVKLRPFSTRPFNERSIAWVPGVMFVGEACGIDQTTGEGIAQAIDMGRMAARHLARALKTKSSRFDGYARDVRLSTTGRHLLQSAWLARRVYGPFGSPARRFLLRSAYARMAAMRWYRNESLDVPTQLRLGFGLMASAFALR